MKKYTLGYGRPVKAEMSLQILEVWCFRFHRVAAFDSERKKLLTHWLAKYIYNTFDKPVWQSRIITLWPKDHERLYKTNKQKLNYGADFDKERTIIIIIIII